MEFRAWPFHPSLLAKFVAIFLGRARRGTYERDSNLMSAAGAIRSSHSAAVLLRVYRLCEVSPVSLKCCPASKKRRYAGGTVDISIARFSPC